MGIAERKVREKKAVRSLILKASWSIVQREGWQALSMRKLADAIEYSPPVIYSHFDGKDALLREFVRQGFRQLNQVLMAVSSKLSEPECRIEGLAEGYLRFALSHRQCYELMYGLGMPACDTIQTVPELMALTAILREPVELMMGGRSAPEENIRMKTRAFWSMLHGLVSIHLMNFRAEEETSVEVLRDLVRSFIKGIR